MNTPFTYEDGSLFIRLLMAHIITDFLLQTEKAVRDKNKNLLKSRAFWLHGLYTGMAAALFMWNKLSWPILGLIIVSHILIDYGKLVLSKKIPETRWEQKDLYLFIIDQVLHILVLILAWIMLINGSSKAIVLLKEIFSNYRILLRILGYLIAIGPITYLIKFLTLRWSDEVTQENNSLKDAGKWIGMLERVIVLTLVLVEQYTAIGFLVTAKSILRLIDKPDISAEKDKQNNFSSRKHTEYVLIGTFLSFGSAVLLGLIINWLLKL